VFGDTRYTQSEAITGFSGFLLGLNQVLSRDTPNATALDAILGPLAKNGGPTMTHRLVSGSPAINSGDNDDCETVDQRGERRSDGRCDIGAYELVEVSCFVVPTARDNVVAFCL
jgi:hypothetical protein